MLNQKSELQRALEKHKTNVARKEMENNVNSKAPELEKVIACRAKKLQDTTAHVSVISRQVGSFSEVFLSLLQGEDDKSLSVEFLQARAKLRTRADSK